MTDDQFSREYGQYLVEEVTNARMTRRQLLVRASVFGLSATAIGSLLAACGGSSSTATSSSATASSSAPVAGGTARVVTSAVLSAFDPVTMYQAADVATVEQICEYLTWVENDLSLRPVLAESWSSDATAKTWTFKLRQGVKFNDGSPFGADDVVATIDRLADPKSGSGALSALKGILSKGGAVKVDDSTVAFHLDSAFADFPYLVSSADYNSVILPRNFDGDFLKNPVGTGPFMLINYAETGKSATLKKNPNYWQKGLPYLDGVAFVYNPDVQAQILQLQGGHVDLMVETPYQGTQALFSDPNIIVQKVPSTAMEEVAMRVDTAPFTDKRVRQAIAYCLDRPGLMKALYAGMGTLGNDEVFAPLYPNSPSLPQRSQDYAKAKSLLTAAGHPDGFSVTITVPSAYLDLPQYATLIQAMCKPAGINVGIKQVTATEYYGGGANTPWLSAAMDIVEWIPRPAAAQFIQAMLLSSSVWSSSHWANPQFDRLATQYNGSIDQASRKNLAAQMATLEQDETPIIIAIWEDSLRATSAKLHDVRGLQTYLDLSKAYWA